MMFTSLRVVLTTAVFYLHCEVAAIQDIIKGMSEDEIKSEHYPAPYPCYANKSWEWNVPTGLWGVVFKEFNLDTGNKSVGSHDWLEIGDRRRKPVTYTAAEPPVMSFTSEGPQLTIHFVSDGESEPTTRGFHLIILYGANDHELQGKIIDATKTKDTGKASSVDSTLLLIIVPAALVVYVVVVTFGVVLLLRMRRQGRSSGNKNRDAFGVRRNSGICHSRRTASTSDEHADVPQQQQQSRTERQLHRSHSQRSWMSRAELTNTLQTVGSTSRKNTYTSTSVSRYGGAANLLPARTCQTATKLFAAGIPSARNRALRSYENDEYSDTVDSLELRPAVRSLLNSDDSTECQPPSYEESYLIPVTSQCNGINSSSSQKSYENFSSNVCSSQPYHGNQTNIYINAGPASGSSCSVNEITIDATSCIITSKFCDRQGDHARGNKSPGNRSFQDAKLAAHQDVLTSSKTSSRRPYLGTMSSSSSLHIIDGYAFIVPSPADDKECEELALNLNYNGQQISTISTGSIDMDIATGGAEASNTDDKKAYSNITKQMYFNIEDAAE